MIPKCVQCKQLGGTIFTNKNNTYYAVCGNKRSPCNLNIEIYNGKYYNTYELLDTFGSEELVRIRTDIICQKMDNLFKYDNENVSLKKFKENMEDFTIMNDEYNELVGKNNNLYKDEIRVEMAARKTQQIYRLISSIKELITQYKKDGNSQLLKAAVEIQVKELDPEINNLRHLHYEIMEVELKKGKKNKTNEEGDEQETEIVYNQSYLFQRYASLQKTQVLIGGGKENVVKYKINAT